MSVSSSNLVAMIEGQPITPEIAREVKTVCYAAQEAMNSILRDIAACLDAKWYSLTGSTRKRIIDINHELCRILAVLNQKVQHLYAEKEDLSADVRGDSAVPKRRTVPPPHWAREVQKSAEKSRHFARLLNNQNSGVSAADVDMIYNDMLDAYELQRLNLVAVVGTVRRLLAALDDRSKVWKQVTAEGPQVGQWLPDHLCELESFKDSGQ